MVSWMAPHVLYSTLQRVTIDMGGICHPLYTGGHDITHFHVSSEALYTPWKTHGP